MITEADMETALYSIERRLDRIGDQLRDNKPILAFVILMDLRDHITELRSKLTARSKPE